MISSDWTTPSNGFFQDNDLIKSWVFNFNSHFLSWDRENSIYLGLHPLRRVSFWNNLHHQIPHPHAWDWDNETILNLVLLFLVSEGYLIDSIDDRLYIDYPTSSWERLKRMEYILTKYDSSIWHTTHRNIGGIPNRDIPE